MRKITAKKLKHYDCKRQAVALVFAAFFLGTWGAAMHGATQYQIHTSHFAPGAQDGPKSLTRFCTFFPLLINIAQVLRNIQLESTINAKCSLIIKASHSIQFGFIRAFHTHRFKEL